MQLFLGQSMPWIVSSETVISTPLGLHNSNTAQIEGGTLYVEMVKFII